MTAVLSYHSDPAIKAKYVQRAQDHRAADEVIQGSGWDGTRGCLVGCLAHAYPAHETLSRDLGADEALFYLADSIHEGLPGDLAKTWPERFTTAMPVGVDLSRVRWRFLHWLLTDEAVNPGISHETVRDAVKAVADLCMSAALGEMPDEDHWSAAESAARSAAESAWSAAWSARSAARSAAQSAAESAWSAAWSAAESAESAAWSARSAARSAAESAAESAAQSAAESAWSAAWGSMSEALLRFLSEAGQITEERSSVRNG